MENHGPYPIGIDLGTTYSCVAVYINDKVEIIANTDGNRITPSIVSYSKENEILVGDSAKNQLSSNQTNTIFNAKRLIGRKFNDPILQEDIKLWPFKVVQEENGDKPQIMIIYQGIHKRLSPEEISSISH